MLVSDNWMVSSLLINCLLRMDAVLKQRFNELLGKGIVDIVFYQMIRDDLLPTWFISEMPGGLPGAKLIGLREALDSAVEECLIGLSENGSGYYFIEFTKEELRGMSAHVGLREEEVDKIAKELNTRLSIRAD